MGKIILDNFIGGLNRSEPERINPAECAVLQNMVHIDGTLKSIEGRNLYNQTPILATAPVKSLHRFYKTGHTVNDSATTRQGWTLARCDDKVWLACEKTTAATGTAGNSYITIATAAAMEMPKSGVLLVKAATPYRLSYSAKDESTGRLTCTVPTGIACDVEMVDFRPILQTPNETGRVGFEQMNGRAYMAASGLYRWDGFAYWKGTLNCPGTGTHVTGTHVNWNNVRAGDKLLVKNGSANTNWTSAYTVSSAGTTVMTLTATGPSTGTAQRDYIIARVNNAGIANPNYRPTLSVATAGAGLSLGTYSYKWTADIGSGESNPSPASANFVAGTGTIASVRIEHYPTFISPGGATFRIYRTVHGGATHKLTKTVVSPNFQYGGGSMTITDDTPDASLGVDLPAASWTDYTPSNAPTVTDQGAFSTLAAGAYKGVFTLYNSLTDCESNPSPESNELTITAGQGITMSMPVTGCDRQADYVIPYLTDQNGEIYYPKADIAWAEGSTSPIAHTETGAVLTERTLPLSEDHQAAPSGVTKLQLFNGRMYAYGVDERVWFSTVNDPEHWPLYEYGVDDNQIIYTDPTLGGFVRCGDPGQPVISVVPDAGSFSQTGSTGANLLIQSRVKAYLWWGKNWTEHRLDEAWSEGLSSGESVVNCGGVLAGLSRNGPFLKPTGSILPERIHEKIFPPARLPFWEEVTAGNGTADYFDLSCGAYWRDYYVFSYCDSPSTVPNNLVMLHLPTLTYSIIGTGEGLDSTRCKAYSLCVFNGPGDAGELMYGESDAGNVYRMFAKTGDYTYWTPSTATGVTVAYRSGLIATGEKPDMLYHQKEASKLQMCFSDPATAQQIDPGIYKEGSNAVAVPAKPVDALTGSSRAYLDIDLSPVGALGRSLAVGFTGTFTLPVTFYGLILDLKQRDR
jgi:hypothetical protein